MTGVLIPPWVMSALPTKPRARLVSALRNRLLLALSGAALGAVACGGDADAGEITDRSGEAAAGGSMGDAGDAGAGGSGEVAGTSGSAGSSGSWAGSAGDGESGGAGEAGSAGASGDAGSAGESGSAGAMGEYWSAECEAWPAGQTVDDACPQDAPHAGSCSLRCYEPGEQGTPEGSCGDPSSPLIEALLEVNPQGSGCNGSHVQGGPYCNIGDASGGCCYLIYADWCDGRPLLVDGRALVAPLRRSSGWLQAPLSVT